MPYKLEIVDLTGTVPENVPVEVTETPQGFSLTASITQDLGYMTIKGTYTRNASGDITSILFEKV